MIYRPELPRAEPIRVKRSGPELDKCPCVLAMALSAVPFYGQKAGEARIDRRTGGIFYPTLILNRPAIDPTMQPNPIIPPLRNQQWPMTRSVFPGTYRKCEPPP